MFTAAGEHLGDRSHSVANTPRPKRPTALIVDHDSVTREMLADYLSRSGVNTVEAEDGLHGWAKAISMTPDVIAVDLGLRGMNGAQLCQSLKKQEGTRQIPVIGLSRSGSGSQVDAAKEAGCISVLTKPVSPDILLQEIRRILDLPQV